MDIGYARVSTGEQNLDLQQDALEEDGCERIFTDQVSGAKSKRPGLTYKIAVKESSHVVVVPARLFSPALDAGVRL